MNKLKDSTSLFTALHSQSLNRLNAKQLRKTTPQEENLKQVTRNPIYIILDRVTDTYNIGSVFRLADAIAAEKVYICGDCEYPPSSRIHKAAVGTEAWVSWEKKEKALEAIQELKDKGVQIISVEQDPRSISYKIFLSQVKFPCAIVIGHETDGVSKEVLDVSDLIVELPMFGINKSFNVWGSGAVIAYKVIELL
jgi:23S rRNA (guanosine2251-2'-O)-methyltransferase